MNRKNATPNHHILIRKYFVCLMTLCFVSLSSNAQNIFENKILPILQTNCGSNGTCHSGNNPAAWLSFEGSPQNIYDQIIGATPQNEYSASVLKHKLVQPGYPERSLLVRKVNNGLHSDSERRTEEGGEMPPNSSISDVDIEMLRQWVYLGAPFDEPEEANEDLFLNREIIEEYYTAGGIGNETIPAPPAAGEGFQIKFGPVFLEPEAETEVLKLYEFDFDDEVEIDRIEVFMHDFSHHFILYRYEDQPDTHNGLRELNLGNAIGSPISPFSSANFMAIWQDSQDFRLPEGTAYKWRDGNQLDLNYHIKNFSTTSILAADAYINVYTKPVNDNNKEMFSDLAIYGANDGILGIFNLNIPAGEEVVFEEEFFDRNEQYNIWMLTSHTHQFGKDYDIYLTDENGEKGPQVFEGHFNTDYTTLQGFYEYEHPPVLYFDNFLEMPPGSSLIHEAVFENTSDQNVGFGLTTNDEMFITILQYTLGDNFQEDFETMPALPEVLCIDDAPFEITVADADGAAGPGVVGNKFHPAIAGEGSHLVVFNCCLPDAVTTHSFTVLPKSGTPTLDATLDNGSLIVSGNTEYELIEWFLDGELIVGENDNVLDVEGSGAYTVRVTEAGSCPAESEPMNIVASGIEFIAFSKMPTVHPNPFDYDSVLEFDLLNHEESVEINAYDLSGKLISKIHQGELNSGSHRFELCDVFADFDEGLFLLQVDMGSFNWTRKLIKQ